MSERTGKLRQGGTGQARYLAVCSNLRARALGDLGTCLLCRVEASKGKGMWGGRRLSCAVVRACLAALPFCHHGVRGPLAASCPLPRRRVHEAK